MTERDAASVSGADTAGDPPTGEADDAAPASFGAQDPEQTAPIAIRPVRAPIAGLRQRMESTAALRRSLAAKEAEALDLRESIERLRREWNDEHGGSSADRPVPAAASAPPAPPTAVTPDTPTESASSESASSESASSESASPESGSSESASPESGSSESGSTGSVPSESASSEPAPSESLFHAAPEQATDADTRPTTDPEPGRDAEPSQITRTAHGQGESPRPPAPRSGGRSAGSPAAGSGALGAATLGRLRPSADDAVPTQPWPEHTTPSGPTIAPGQQVGSSRPRRWMWLALALLLTVLLLLLVSRCGDASTGTSVGGTATQGAGASVDATASGQSTSGPVPGAGVTVPNGTPTSGPGLSEPGTHAEASVGADQTSIQVYESAILPNAATDPLVFTPTPVSAEVRPAVQDVVVELDGTPVQGIRQDDGSWTVPVPEGGYTRVAIGYRLADAVVVSQPAKAGRAAAVVTPLTTQLSQAAGTPVQVRTADPQVIGVDCPFAPPAEWLCAGQSDGAWTATLPAASSEPVVSLLLNLAS